jgi:hypothetical protein
MTHFIAAALVLSLGLAASACHKGSSRLEGHWRGIRADGTPPAVLGQATAFASELELVASGNRITVVSGGRERTIEYTIQKESGAELVVVLGGADLETFTFVDDKTMRWAVTEGASVTFMKQ